MPRAAVLLLALAAAGGELEAPKGTRVRSRPQPSAMQVVTHDLAKPRPLPSDAKPVLFERAPIAPDSAALVREQPPVEDERRLHPRLVVLAIGAVFLFAWAALAAALRRGGRRKPLGLG